MLASIFILKIEIYTLPLWVSFKCMLSVLLLLLTNIVVLLGIYWIIEKNKLVLHYI